VQATISGDSISVSKKLSEDCCLLGDRPDDRGSKDL
jgi:hypothetical protein